MRVTMSLQKSRQPYVSSRRAELRDLSAPSFFDSEEEREKHAAKNVDPKTGHLTYRPKGPGFLETYSESKARNRSLISSTYRVDCQRIPRILELEYRIASHYFWMEIPNLGADVSPVFGLLQRSFAANLIAINSAFELTLDGLYANARPIMRQAYEGLMIAKFCSLNPASDVCDRWLDGEQIYFTRDILHRIDAPSPHEFACVWKDLSGCTHSSAFTGQPDLANKPVVEAAPLNFIFAQMLLEANYHLLCTHLITGSMRYYQRYLPPSDELKRHRLELQSLFSKRKIPRMAQVARNFIRKFRAKWVLK